MDRHQLSLVVGETIVLLAGGAVYLFFAVKNGAWDGAMIKSAPKKDLMISLICAGIFSVVFYLILKKNVAVLQAIGISVGFFAAVSSASYALLRGLSHLSRKKSDERKG